MTYWIGIVNEAIPLSEHYHLMLASKETAIAELVEQPRATGDWKWAHWTGAGRVVRRSGRSVRRAPRASGVGTVRAAVLLTRPRAARGFGHVPAPNRFGDSFDAVEVRLNGDGIHQAARL